MSNSNVIQIGSSQAGMSCVCGICGVVIQAPPCPVVDALKELKEWAALGMYVIQHMREHMPQPGANGQMVNGQHASKFGLAEMATALVCLGQCSSTDPRFKTGMAGLLVQLEQMFGQAEDILVRKYGIATDEEGTILMEAPAPATPGRVS